MALEEQTPIEKRIATPKKDEKEKYKGIHTTLYQDPTTFKKHVIIGSQSPNPIIDNILNYLSVTGFVHILNCGMSGTGKSTWTRHLIHGLHTRKNFQVHWYYRDEIQQLDQIIAGLTKGLNHIIVLDDASFALEELPREKLANLAKRLTYIRHDVKAEVVLIMNVHYSKALRKFFRAVPFTFLTSISMEEVQSFQDLFGGYSRYKLKDFSYYYQQMMFRKQWTIEMDRWNNRTVTYKTNDPFRLGLACEGNYLHFFLYTKNSCNVCDPDFATKRIIESKEMVDQLVHSYGVQNARSIMRLYSFAKHGKKVLDSTRTSIWHTLSEFDKNNQVDWDEVNTLLDQTMTNRRKRTYVKKQDMAETLAELNKKTKALERERANLAKAIDEDDRLKNEAEELEKNYGEDSDSMKEGMKEDYDQQETDEAVPENKGYGDDQPSDFGSISDDPEET